MIKNTFFQLNLAENVEMNSLTSSEVFQSRGHQHIALISVYRSDKTSFYFPSMKIDIYINSDFIDCTMLEYYPLPETSLRRKYLAYWERAKQR